MLAVELEGSKVAFCFGLMKGHNLTRGVKVFDVRPMAAESESSVIDRIHHDGGSGAQSSMRVAWSER